MLAYRAIDINRSNSAANKMSHSLLEKVLKVYKLHRSTADTDTKWISDVVGTMKNPIYVQ